MTNGSDINEFSAAYAAFGLPSNGPAITKSLIRMMNALSDGIMILIIFLVGIAVILISILCIRFILLLQTQRDRTEICTLKALGIGKRDIKRICFSKYLAFSVYGGAIGLAAYFLLILNTIKSRRRNRRKKLAFMGFYASSKHLSCAKLKIAVKIPSDD